MGRYIEPRARIANDYNRFGLNAATRHRPEVFVVVKSRAVAEGAAGQFQAVVVAITTILMTTAIPRHGAGGIGRSNSKGGPP
ncbi:MAG: hypothetical protein DME70_09835 [Verrucomicrobia bacterium]|nr:MAG: hypothetical protein DME70_09835 [Verrucomicrobiota bacterium]